MSVRSRDSVMYEHPAIFDENGKPEIKMEIITVKSVVFINNRQQFIDKDSNFYFEYRVRKIFRDGETIDNVEYDLDQITRDTQKIKEEYDKSC